MPSRVEGVCPRCREAARPKNKSYCVPCQRLFNKEHYAKNKSYYIDKADRRYKDFQSRVDKLKDVPCADCGGRWPPVGMDFDHLRDKEIEVSRLVQRAGSWKKILDEIGKCEIVCAACHRVRTMNRRLGLVP